MNMTPMIDIVFQLIIFFVLTVDMNNKALDERIKLAMAPHGKAVDGKDHREFVIEVDEEGVARVSRTPISPNNLKATLLQIASQPGGRSTPIVIRADGRVPHAYVRGVMDTCANSGFWKLKFSAIKEEAEKPVD
jgi:biopolymer transport protein ExbD